MFVFQNELGEKAPACALGLLIMGDIQQADAAALAAAKLAVESQLRTQYAQAARAELKALHPMDTYVAYYKRFGSTYHVLLQLESLIQGKPIPGGLPPVQAMFMAELKNMLLTAGHDLERLTPPLCLRAATGAERYLTLGGREAATVANDLFLADQEGIISSILKGPDQRTAITAETRQALYTVYAPAGIEKRLVLAHLTDIESYTRLYADQATTRLKEVYGG